MTELRLIKKYPNRRLYDTAESRYVTLMEVKDLISQAVPFKVVDNQSEMDITRSILLQIILELESAGQPLFSVELLERFIRLYGDPTQAAFSSFLDQSLDFFMRQQRAMGEQLQSLWGLNPMDFWLKLGEKSLSLGKETSAPPPGQAGDTAGDTDPGKPA